MTTMTPEQLKDFFFWMMIINLGLFFYSMLICTLGQGLMFRMKTALINFPMERETFRLILYCFLGIYKLLILFFCVIPYLALLIVL